jgi:hypothetical protein
MVGTSETQAGPRALRQRSNQASRSGAGFVLLRLMVAKAVRVSSTETMPSGSATGDLEASLTSTPPAQPVIPFCPA